MACCVLSFIGVFGFYLYPDGAAFLQMLQHPWTYKPLVHDVLGLALNKVTVEAPEPAGAAPAVLKPPPKRQTFEVSICMFGQKPRR